jgi:Mrp family chromosome partitioning ATPase
VLLVEGDFRHPSLQGLLRPASTPAAGHGFAGDLASWRGWVCADAQSGLCYLSVPRPVHNATRLIEGGGMEILIREASAEYDLVVVDSPPVMRVPDAMLLARYVDAVALVIWWRKTPQACVREALHRLSPDPAKLTGVVLTKVKPGKGTLPEGVYGGYPRLAAS